MREIIEQKLQILPKSPGVYKFLDGDRKILYIGKAANLRQRVSSYFKEAHVDRPHIIPMISKIHDIEYVKTVNEVDALILEAALIKKHQPKYNVDLKDDKSFGWIYVSTRERIPQVKIVRSINKKDYKGGRLFGPYPHGMTIRRVYKYIRKIYPFCNCKNDREELLYNQIGLCPGPNIGEVPLDEYKKHIGKLCDFLNGKVASPIRDLEREMRKQTEIKNYEKASILRDKINDLRYITQKIDIDHLSTERDYKIKRRALLKKSNMELAKELNLEKINRIECYDISNMGGDFSYGSMVVANSGVIDSSDYRAFKIKDVEGADDYASLGEVLQRRLSHIKKSDETDTSLSMRPDIILLDGGKGQVNSAAGAVPDDIILMGISKGRKFKRAGGRKRNQYWLRVIGEDGKKEVQQIILKSDFILVNLRDEAHRFAIKFYRRSHGKNLIKE